MTDRIYNVLFICSTNCARSIMAEAAMNKLGEGRFHGFSGGAHPEPALHDLTLKVLEKHGCSTLGLRPKSWDEFAVTGAPQMDFVFTVCDKAAGEACPSWPGMPLTAHWGIANPMLAPIEEREAAYDLAYQRLENRIRAFIWLPFEKLDPIALRAEVYDIARYEGASDMAYARAVAGA